LITSRLDSWSAQVRGFDLQTLTKEDALSFLLERTAARRQHKASDAEDAAALAARLDGLALALEQAGAYIAERRISFDRYLNLFHARRKEVLKWHDKRLMRYPASVAVTWLTSFGQLKPAACGLLDSLSFLASDPIPRSMIEKVGEAPELGEALAELSRYSLVRFLDEPPESFSIHRLVQEIVRSRLGGTARKAWERAVDLLLREAPQNSGDVSHWNAWRRLAPHCAAVLAGTEPQDSSLSVLRLMNGYAIFMQFANAEYAEAEPFFQRGLEASERVLGPEHPDTLTSLSNLAALLHAKGDCAGAEPLHRRTLEARERVLGGEHPSTLTSLSNLAFLLHAKGDHAGAEPLHRRALEARERVLGPEHPDTL
ncbi:MAG: tetratricopeptide repeat protein, partial [Verrucomicrobiaceae bacterium]